MFMTCKKISLKIWIDVDPECFSEVAKVTAGVTGYVSQVALSAPSSI